MAVSWPCYQSDWSLTDDAMSPLDLAPLQYFILTKSHFQNNWIKYQLSLHRASPSFSLLFCRWRPPVWQMPIVPKLNHLLLWHNNLKILSAMKDKMVDISKLSLVLIINRWVWQSDPVFLLTLGFTCWQSLFPNNYSGYIDGITIDIDYIKWLTLLCSVP